MCCLRTRVWRFKLLALTILFVMLGEVLIFVPSIAKFRIDWLQDRLSSAKIASLVLEAAPDNMVPDTLRHTKPGTMHALRDSIWTMAGRSRKASSASVFVCIRLWNSP